MHSSEERVVFLLRTALSMHQLRQSQALLVKSNIAARLPSLLSKLLSLSALSPWGSLAHARSLFDSSTLLLESTFAHNVMLRAYSASIFPTETLLIYNSMCCFRIVPIDNFTFPFVLKALGRAVVVVADGPALTFALKGSEVHCRAFHLGFDSDMFVQNALICMYSRCGWIDHARSVFDEMALRDAISWNTMFVAYDRIGNLDLANELLKKMPEKNVSLWNSIIARYARLGNVEAARRVFEEMAVRDAVSWNSLIAGFVRVKDYKSALRLFRSMVTAEVVPTRLTIVSVLGACAETGAFEVGREIHGFLMENEIEIEGFVGNALLDMYAKCGNLKLAREVFDMMNLKHVTCWNSMIVALSIHGHSEEALDLFASLEEAAIKPNRITFLGALLACSHKGLVEEGRALFHKMKKYDIHPDIKHYGCMVDILSRCGLLEEAYQLIKEMPFRANAVLWKTVIAACKVHGNVDLAERAFGEIGKLEKPDDADFVLMSNIYAEAGRWQGVEHLRTGMIGCNISKEPGYALVELNG
ncbi:pentatricopeptide repeat-containing protein At1g74630-like [Phalaenopsis equestris]|uniref:pentatricopeptide repeat-containing protein At1g74630-like n=1 Tax=Phalaenopsis equestris TaxID=78828 RepID=UPI0009E5653F|nr:pentatricopeptide repeat-containing protein At1g74630-like [Phalaenopsis equestris]